MGDKDATSLVLKNVDTKRKQDQDMLSAEDLAWADSCLIEDPEVSEPNMDSLKEALLNILDQHSEILGPFANKGGDSNDITDPENLPSVIEEGTSHIAETSMDEHSEDESPDVSSPIKQPFLPNYNDEMMNIQFSDSDDDYDAGFMSSEVASGDIFKVWDFDDVPVEEDELVKRLKEALTSNDATTRVPRKKGSKFESLDTLIESIADLSLN